MSPRDDGTEFEGAEPYYAEYRPRYGEAVIDHLVDHFDLDADGRVLDLGCGAGQIAIPLAGRVGEVVGMDPNAEMLRYARENAAEAGRENLAWVHGSDADLDDQGPFRLVTVGRAFHRMDRDHTLSWVRGATEPGGGIAIVMDDEWLTKGRREWQADVYDVADRYVADLPERRDPAEIEYEESWTDLVADHGFDVSVATFEYEREWDPESAAGYVLSLSFCSPAVLGDDRAAFEAEVRETLRERPADTLLEDVTVEVIAGTTKG